jgi:hypothetical protein
MAILNLFSSGLGRSEDDVAKIASARRALKDTDIKSIGDRFKAETDKFQSAVAAECSLQGLVVTIFQLWLQER